MAAPSSRMLTLLSLLQARRDWPGPLLAERLAVSDRTVRRDVDRLRELGYRILPIKGPDGGYRLDAGSELPPLLFDDDQAVAIAVALRIAAVSGAGVEEGAARALTTVRQVMPSRLRHRIDALRVTAVPRSPDAEDARVDPRVLLALSAAVEAQEVLRFDYLRRDDDRGDALPRRVEGHGVATWSGRWYLVAWDLDREDWRVFRADRVRPHAPTRRRFAPRELPGGDVRTFLRARFRGSVDAARWPCEGEVILSLPASDVAPYLEDGAVEDLGRDRCRVSAGAWSWIGLAASLGRFDADMEVVGPPELGAAFATLAARFAAAGVSPSADTASPRAPASRAAS